jgi:SAM-dependent methyltransferase
MFTHRLFASSSGKAKALTKQLLGRLTDRIGRLGYREVIPISPEERMDSWNPSTTQEFFCQWNAERLGVSVDEIRERYAKSWSSLPNGHAGAEYRLYTTLSARLLQVFYNDSQREVYEAYRIHALMDFLRMLSYEEVTWPDDHPIVEGLSGKSHVTVLDYGCGLAQHSRGLADALRRSDTSVRLVLADIPTPRKDFLQWLCQRMSLPMEFLDCTPTDPLPPLPLLDVCIATEVFEHLHDPISSFEAIHKSLKPFGFLNASIHDHRPEFMHVSPDLSTLRERLVKLNYEEIVPSLMFRKPAGD